MLISEMYQGYKKRLDTELVKRFNKLVGQESLEPKVYVQVTYVTRIIRTEN